MRQRSIAACSVDSILDPRGAGQISAPPTESPEHNDSVEPASGSETLPALQPPAGGSSSGAAGLRPRREAAMLASFLRQKRAYTKREEGGGGGGGGGGGRSREAHRRPDRIAVGMKVGVETRAAAVARPAVRRTGGGCTSRSRRREAGRPETASGPERRHVC